MNNSKEKLTAYFNTNGYYQFYNNYIKADMVTTNNGQSYTTRCPFKDHKNDKSFNINSKTGKYSCALCGKQGSAIHFFAKIRELDNRRDYYKILVLICDDLSIKYEDVKQEIIDTYDYVDENGDLLYQTVRFEPKKFAQRHMVDDKWIWDIKGLETVLYNLPRVMESKQIIIVEGEKDVNNLEDIGIRDLGIAATTCPLGSGKWKDDFNNVLKDKLIILIPDNDVAGRNHMIDVGKRLAKSAGGMKWIDLPGLSDKQDVTDYINKFDGNVDAVMDLNNLINTAEYYESSITYSFTDGIIGGGNFMNMEIEDKKCYLNPWLTNSSITLIAGDRNVGKSWIGLAIAEAVTKGISLGPWECEIPASCMYVDGEMSIRYFQNILKKMQIKYIDEAEPLYIYSDYYANTLNIPRINLFNANSRDNLKQACKANHIKVLILDNLASLAPGADENVKKDWDVINQWLIDMRFGGIAVIMLHHTNKSGQQRGTSAREDNIDNSILLRFPVDYGAEQGVRFKMAFTKNRAMRDHHLLADHDVWMDVSDSDNYKLIFDDTKQNQRDIIAQYLTEGYKQVEISEMTGLSKGRVSQVVKTIKQS